ncbi:MAG: 30S ribosomal protein S4 [bacterium JZ-2024 1]
MSRYLEARCRICRRAGEKLFLKGEKCRTNCPLDKEAQVRQGRGLRRGRSRRVTPFASQLLEKQKIRFSYGIGERQFARYFKGALRKKGVTGHEIFRVLESRLDTVLRRAGFSLSQQQARQWATHGHFLVNGRPVNIPSYELKPGDVVSLKPGSLLASKAAENLRRSIEMGLHAPWIELDAEKLKATLVRLPDREEVYTNILDRLVVEFYTR